MGNVTALKACQYCYYSGREASLIWARFVVFSPWGRLPVLCWLVGAPPICLTWTRLVPRFLWPTPVRPWERAFCHHYLLSWPGAMKIKGCRTNYIRFISKLWCARGSKWNFWSRGCRWCSLRRRSRGVPLKELSRARRLTRERISKNISKSFKIPDYARWAQVYFPHVFLQPSFS